MHVVEDGAGPGLDPTAERAEDGQVNVVGHLDNVVLVGDGVSRKTGLPEVKVQVAVGGVEAVATVKVRAKEVEFVNFLTHPRVTG